MEMHRRLDLLRVGLDSKVSGKLKPFVTLGFVPEAENAMHRQSRFCRCFEMMAGSKEVTLIACQTEETSCEQSCIGNSGHIEPASLEQ